MPIRVHGSLSDLVADFDIIREQSRRDMDDVVRRNIRAGGLQGQRFARSTAGAHGRWYPSAITWEMTTAGDDGVIRGEWGPDSSLPQGGMSFEDGSRNQKPHHDLAKSADITVPTFAREVDALPDQWFWPR